MRERFFEFCSFLASGASNSLSIRFVKYAGVVSSMCLCSCTVLLNPPARPGNDDITDGLTYKNAYAYLARARTQMQTDVTALENLDATNKGMVAGGVAGAGVAALFKGSSDLVLSLLTVGGLGYVTSQNVQPSVRIGIYRAGLKNLDCIDDAASGLNLQNVRLKEASKRLTLKIERLKIAIHAGRADKDKGPSLKDFIDDAENAARAAEILGVQIDSTVSIDDKHIGRSVYSAVNQTVMSVSQQLDASAPSIDAIAQASSIGSFVSAHQDAKAQGKATASTTQDALTKVQRTSQSAPPAWLTEMRVSLEQLTAEVSAVQNLLSRDVISTSAIGTCKTIAPDAEPMQIVLRADMPASGAPVRAGETYNFQVTGDATGTPRIGWSGPEPTIAQLVAQYSDGKLQVMAPANARPGQFTIYLYDSSSKDATHRASNKVDINVAPASQPEPKPPAQRKEPAKSPGEKKAGGGPIPPPPGTVAAGSAADTGGGKLTRIGLPPDVKPDDPRYIGRVKKLENCARLPVTGKMSDPLQAYLNKFGPINANGDCPAPGAPATASPPGAGGASMPTPPPVAGAAPANSGVAKPATH